jgi:hypothetical protein
MISFYTIFACVLALIRARWITQLVVRCGSMIAEQFMLEGEFENSIGKLDGNTI